MSAQQQAIAEALSAVKDHAGLPFSYGGGAFMAWPVAGPIFGKAAKIDATAQTEFWFQTTDAIAFKAGDDVTQGGKFRRVKDVRPLDIAIGARMFSTGPERVA